MSYSNHDYLTYNRFCQGLRVLLVRDGLNVRSEDFARRGIILLVLVQHDGHGLGPAVLILVPDSGNKKQ